MYAASGIPKKRNIVSTGHNPSHQGNMDNGNDSSDIKRYLPHVVQLASKNLRGELHVIESTMFYYENNKNGEKEGI